MNFILYCILILRKINSKAYAIFLRKKEIEYMHNRIEALLLME